MFKLAQKIRKEAACLLLFSFLNVLTFLPGTQLDVFGQEASAAPFAKSIILPEDDELARSTVIELILENVAGLEDCLPDSEKPDFSYDYFSIKFRCISAFLTDIIAPQMQDEPNKIPLIASVPGFAPDHAVDLPLLQHHNFIFRLTPF